MAVRFVSYPHFYCVSLVSISFLASVPPFISESLHCTPEQNRTVTIITDNKILSLARLPISPPGYFVVRRGIEPRISH